MKPGYKSTIEVSPETGRKSLIVFYDSETDDFDEAIKEAIVFQNILPGQMNVIAYPAKSVGIGQVDTR